MKKIVNDKINDKMWKIIVNYKINDKMWKIIVNDKINDKMFKMWRITNSNEGNNLKILGPSD